MMNSIKHITLVLTFIILAASSFDKTHAQAATWTWMHGTTNLNYSGNYVTPNVFDPANDPPSLYEPVYWRDANGWLWVYGGYFQNPFKTVFTEMWCYNPYINQWKMVKSFSNTPTYGIKGVASPNNSPGARTYCCPAWVDNNGKFWLYSGMDFSFGNYCDDIWMYDPVTGNWTWMYGSQQFSSAQAVYGVKGVPSPLNSPGQRNECYTAWCDGSGDFWIFGGQSYSTTSSQANFNDMWRFDHITHEWTWMHGDSVPEAPGSFGTLGVSSPANVPPSRWCYDSSQDPSGNFYFFGGVHAVGGLPTVYNEVWKYDPSVNEWVWIKGSSSPGSMGTYPAFCTSSLTANPAMRYENKGSTSDACGNIWTYGGVRLGGFLNDVWVYIAASNEWKLLKGNNQLNLAAIRGTMGVPNINNRPEGRSGSVAFLDTLQRFYIYGGAVTGNIMAINDVWRLTLDPGCVISPCASGIPTALFSSSDTLLCEKGSIDFYDNSTGNPTSWNWTFTGGSPATSTLQNPTGIFFANYGTFNVSLTATNAAGSNTSSYTVTVVPNPVQPSITYNGSTLCSTPAASYQWYYSNAPIPNATTQCYMPTLPGNYYVIITDSNGCNSASNIFVANAIEDHPSIFENLTIHPNPAHETVGVSFTNNLSGLVTIEMVDGHGSKVWSNTAPKFAGAYSKNIQVGELAKGLYVIVIKFNDTILTRNINVN